MAYEHRRSARQGGDPSDLRPEPVTPTFAEACRVVIDDRRPRWHSPRSAAQWEASLRDYALPVIGHKPVGEITVADILHVLSPLWDTKQETARRVKHRLSAVMDWAVIEGHRPDNPVERCAARLPKQNDQSKNFRAVPHTEVADAVAVVRNSAAWPVTRACFEFAVLTACRPEEARSALWSEIRDDVWTVPGVRTKSRLEFRVPLSTMALLVLNEARELSDCNGLIFPSRSGRTLSNSAMRRMLIRVGVDSTVHGFRSSFRNWCAESGVSDEVAETCLAHVPNKVAAAHRRTDLIDLRREVMEQWGRYVSGETLDVTVTGEAATKQ